MTISKAPLSRNTLQLKDRLCLALDVDDIGAARHILDQTLDHIGIVKIGYQLGFNGGLGLAKELSDDGYKVFLDFKLMDIGNTVAKGIQSLAKINPAFITIHAYPQVMQAALSVVENTSITLLGVTVLTSMNDQDIRQAGYAHSAKDLVMKRAENAQEMGMHGLVCSALEAKMIREYICQNIILVTPGIRPEGSNKGDQKRVLTPQDAIKNGSDILVVGRPILHADDPKNMCQTIMEEIDKALN